MEEIKTVSCEIRLNILNSTLVVPLNDDFVNETTQ